MLGRLREMTIQEGSGQLAVFVETFRKHAAEHEALSDAATDFGPLLARAVARSEVTSPALCILQVKVGEMSEERASLQDILAEMTKTAHRMTLLEVSRAGQDRTQPHALSLHIGSAPAARLCFDYLDGKCGRKNCDFEHREPCRNHAKGRCKRGSSCSYGHDPRIKSDVKGEKLDDDHKPRPLGHDPASRATPSRGSWAAPASLCATSAVAPDTYRGHAHKARRRRALRPRSSPRQSTQVRRAMFYNGSRCWRSC